MMKPYLVSLGMLRLSNDGGLIFILKRGKHSSELKVG